MSAISAFSASKRRARSSTRSRSAARATRTPRSARSSAAASARTRSPTRSRRSSRPILRLRTDRSEKFLDAYRRRRRRAVQGGALWWRSQGCLMPSRGNGRAGRDCLEARYGALRAGEIIERAAEQVICRRNRGGVVLRRRFGGAAAHDRRDRPHACRCIFLDTGKHFEETLDYRDALVRRFRPDRRPRDHARLEAALSRDRSRRQASPDATPTPAATSARSSRWRAASSRSAPGSPGASASRRRRAAALPVFEAVGPRVRINPLARWTTADLADYMRAHACARIRWSPMAICRSAASPARSRCKPGEDARSGRWAGQAKTECGIHLTGLEKSLPGASC